MFTSVARDSLPRDVILEQSTGHLLDASGRDFLRNTKLETAKP